MLRLLSNLLALLLPIFAFASQTDSPVTFSRGNILLMPKAPVDIANKQGVVFDVEIRGFGSLHSPSWFDFASVNSGQGVLLTLDSETNVTIYPVNHYSKLDILMLNAYGDIIKILPNLSLAGLPEPVESGVPVVAVLYIKGGVVDALGIAPGDSVKYKIFKTRPEVRTLEEKPQKEQEPKVKTPESEQKIRENLENLILKRHHQN